MNRAHRGFTLVEVIVVMALLSVVMLALGAALRTIGQTEQRIDQRLARADEFRVATSFLRSTLGHISARKIKPLAQEGASLYLFAAAPGAVAWVGVMPARYGAGGRHFFHLSAEQLDDGSQGLVLRFLPWTDANTFPDWSQADRRTLVSNVTAFAIRYENQREVPSIWTPDWTIADQLPGHIALAVRTATGPWPDIIVPMRLLSLTGGSGGATIMGRE